MSVSRRLAEWMAGLTWDGVPPEMQRLARLVWADSFGCMLLGSHHRETVALSTMLAARDPHGRTAWAVGAAPAQTPLNAVLVNALACGVEVFDGGNVASRGHVPGYVMPAVLGAAEATGATLGEALAAFVGGCEIAARVGASCQLEPELHPSATWGAIGAAAAVAWLRGATAEAIARAIDLAANTSFAPSWDAATHGANVRSLYSALPSYMGSIVADLAGAGFAGGPAAVEVTFGQISGHDFDPGRCTDELGETWFLTHTYLKLYPSCRNFHAALDALFEARAALPAGFAYGEVEVGVDPIAYRDNRALHIGSDLAAKESLPVNVALALVKGSLAPELFSSGAYRDEAVLDLAGRIVVHEAARARPADRPGWIAIDSPQGPVRRNVAVPLGNPGKPIAIDTLKEKFVANASGILGRTAASRFDDMVERTAPHTPFSESYAAWLGQAEVRAAG